MEIISKVSKGSKMDQVYIPKNRSGLSVGSPVIIKPLEGERIAEKPYFYNIDYIEPAKLIIINEIVSIIDKNCIYENIIFTGSFLDRGFNFNDIDLMMVSDNAFDVKNIKEIIEDKTGINAHIIKLSNNELIKGLSTDPLYQMMLSKCISKKRLIYNIKNEINYKLLDLHLLKSKTLIDNFDILNGNEKYYLTRNLISIYLYIKKKKINNEIVNSEIKKIFGADFKEIKNNMVGSEFLKKFKEIYKKTFNIIMESIKNDAKQK